MQVASPPLDTLLIDEKVVYPVQKPFLYVQGTSDKDGIVSFSPSFWYILHTMCIFLLESRAMFFMCSNMPILFAFIT